jgi:hypothetical protein
MRTKKWIPHKEARRIFFYLCVYFVYDDYPPERCEILDLTKHTFQIAQVPPPPP